MGVLELSDLGYTYADYARWPGDWELIDGAPVAMTPAPTVAHQALAGEIFFQFRSQLEGCNQCRVLGEVDWKVSAETVVRPDMVVTCGEQHDAYLIRAPEIAVEVVSPATARRDEGVKFRLYGQEKVRYYVLVYADDQRAKIYRLVDRVFDKVGDFVSETAHFEGLPCPLSLDFGKVFACLKR